MTWFYGAVNNFVLWRRPHNLFSFAIDIPQNGNPIKISRTVFQIIINISFNRIELVYLFFMVTKCLLSCSPLNTVQRRVALFRRYCCRFEIIWVLLFFVSIHFRKKLPLYFLFINALFFEIFNVIVLIKILWKLLF